MFTLDQVLVLRGESGQTIAPLTKKLSAICTCSKGKQSFLTSRVSLGILTTPQCRSPCSAQHKTSLMVVLYTLSLRLLCLCSVFVSLFCFIGLYLVFSFCVFSVSYFCSCDFFFLERERKSIELEGWGGREELGKGLIRICHKKIYIFKRP